VYGRNFHLEPQGRVNLLFCCIYIRVISHNSYNITYQLTAINGYLQ
jgi:hypothetical protein